jgi:hypothetical protein
VEKSDFLGNGRYASVLYDFGGFRVGAVGGRMLQAKLS